MSEQVFLQHLEEVLDQKIERAPLAKGQTGFAFFNGALQYFFVDKESLTASSYRPLSFDFGSMFEILEQQKRKGLSPGPLLKALKLSKKVKIVDGTCGSGEDTAFFLFHGAKVLALERDPRVFALLLDAHRRAREDSQALVRERAERLEIIHADVFNSSCAIEKFAPDFVYLDPMWEFEQRKALPRKEMKIFAQILQRPLSQEEFLQEIKRHLVGYKVVLKRSRKHPKGPLVNASYAGKTTRYDLVLA